MPSAPCWYSRLSFSGGIRGALLRNQQSGFEALFDSSDFGFVDADFFAPLSGFHVQVIKFLAINQSIRTSSGWRALISILFIMFSVRWAKRALFGRSSNERINLVSTLNLRTADYP